MLFTGAGAGGAEASTWRSSSSASLHGAVRHPRAEPRARAPCASCAVRSLHVRGEQERRVLGRDALGLGLGEEGDIAVARGHGDPGSGDEHHDPDQAEPQQQPDEDREGRQQRVRGRVARAAVPRRAGGRRCRCRRSSRRARSSATRSCAPERKRNSAGERRRCDREADHDRAGCGCVALIQPSPRSEADEREDRGRAPTCRSIPAPRRRRARRRRWPPRGGRAP